MTEARSRRVDLDGLEIAYRDSGTSDPAILLVHGNSASTAVWDPLFASPLARRWRLLAMDLPGCGASGRLRAYSFAGLANVIAAFVKATGCEEAVFAGHSLGGNLLLEAAPLLRLARGFAIWGAPPIARPPAMDRAFLPTPAPGYGVSADLTDDDISRWLGVMFAPGSTIPAGMAPDIRKADPRLRRGIGTSVSALAYADEVLAVRHLGRPLAVLHGEFDAMVSLPYVESLEMPTLWRGHVQVIGDAGHYPNFRSLGSGEGIFGGSTNCKSLTVGVWNPGNGM